MSKNVKTLVLYVSIGQSIKFYKDIRYIYRSDRNIFDSSRSNGVDKRKFRTPYLFCAIIGPLKLILSGNGCIQSINKMFYDGVMITKVKGLNPKGTPLFTLHFPKKYLRLVILLA